MDPREVRDFAGRDWEAIQSSKREYWADRLEAEGIMPLLTAADSLRDLVRVMHPDWPGAEQRNADYENHVRLKRLLDRARNVFSSR